MGFIKADQLPRYYRIQDLTGAMMDKFWDLIYEILGEGEMNGQPPGSTQSLKLAVDEDGGYEIASTDINDGSDLWLGNPWEWHVIYSTEDARRLAWFILFDWWAKGTWFGLKRLIWYRALHRKVVKYTVREQ